MPEYLHPSVRSTITDRSFVFQSAQGSTVLFSAFMAEKGPDNVIVELNSADEAIFYFGEPNLAKYGQAFYNVIEWLKNGGKVQAIRILPTTATFSTLMIQLSTIITATSREITPSITAISAGSAPASLAAARTILNAPVVPVINGAVTTSTYPLGIVLPIGRGASYNGMGVRITLLDNLDNTFDFRTYNFEVTVKDATGNDVVVEGPFIVSFDRFAKSKSRESMYFVNVLNKYSEFVQIIDNAGNIDEVVEFVQNGNTTANPVEYDIFFGLEKSGKEVVGGVKHENVLLATTANIDITTGGLLTIDGVVTVAGNRVLVKNQTSAIENGIYVVAAGAWTRASDLDIAGEVALNHFTYVTNGDTQANTGWIVSGSTNPILGSTAINWSSFNYPIHAFSVWNVGSNATNDPTNPAAINYLANGSDGVWAGGNSEESLLVNAYSGITVPAILDKRQYPIDVILDSNTSSAVKNAMSDLAGAIRGDCVALIDTGFQANVSDTIDYRVNSISMSDRNTAIFAHDFIVFDSFNGENIKVTTPYFLASKIPVNDDTQGIQYPFVGPLTGAISGFEAINFLPNEAEKENLYKKQINYVERDPKRTNLGSQLTSQTANSALSDLNNVRALLRMVREVEEMMSDNRFKFNDQITLDDMNYDLNNYLQKWKNNRTCSSIAGTVYRSDYDRQQKIARVKIELVFTGIIERVFVDWVVNR